MSAHVRPRASSTPRRWLRDRDEPQVAMTSPMPARPGERQRVRAGGDPDPGHLGQATGHQPRLAVVAEAELLRGARRDRDDVLEGPAQLDAEHVAVHVEPEPTAAEPLLDPSPRAPRPPPPRPPTPAAGGRSPARGWGPTARRRAADRWEPASAMTWVIRRWVLGSMPFTTDSTAAVAGRCPAARSSVSRTWVDGTATTTRSIASAIAAGSSVARIASGRSMPGRRASLRRVSRIRAAVSGEWLTSVTGSRWARMAASVVPQAPAPRTATRAGAPANREDASRPLGAAHQLRRLRATRRLAGRFSRICSRNTSRIGVPSKLYASRSRFSRYRRYEKWIDVGSVAKNTNVGGATPAWVAYRIFAPAPADHRRRGALDRRGDQPVELAGRDAPSSLAPHVDRELEHLLHALAGLGRDRDDRGVVDERRARAGGWPRTRRRSCGSCPRRCPTC